MVDMLFVAWCRWLLLLCVGIARCLFRVVTLLVRVCGCCVLVVRACLFCVWLRLSVCALLVARCCLIRDGVVSCVLGVGLSVFRCKLLLVMFVVRCCLLLVVVRLLFGVRWCRTSLDVCCVSWLVISSLRVADVRS